MTSKSEDPSPDDVAGFVERIRAGARQRQAENAAREDELAGWPPPLEALRRYERLVEPSFDAESGGRAVWLQKVFYHLFAKRGHRALLRQQNEFNRQVGLALRDLCDRQRRLGDRMTALEDRLDARGRSGEDSPGAHGRSDDEHAHGRSDEEHAYGRSDEEHAYGRSDEERPGAHGRSDDEHAHGRSDEEHAYGRSDEERPGARDRNDEDPPAP